MSDVDTQPTHEAVNFLADFQKGHCAQKPYQDIPCYGFLANGRDFPFHFSLGEGKGRRRTDTGDQQDCRNITEDMRGFERVNTSG